MKSRERVFSVAIGALDDHNRLLVVKRSEDADEFKGKLSIPTFSLPEEEFSALLESQGVAPERARSTSDRKAYPPEIFQNSDLWRVSRVAVRDRSSYLLAMALVLVHCADRDLIARIESRPNCKFMHADEFIEKSGNGIGTCSSLLMCQLMETGIIPGTTKYLEISPALSDLTTPEIERLGTARLWRDAIENYHFYREGWGGSNSYNHLQLLDKFLLYHLESNARSASAPLRVLDYGSGHRSNLAQCAKSAKYQVEFFDPNNEGSSHKHLGECGQFDLIYATNVAQWIEDLPASLAELRVALRSSDSRLIVSLPTPEFYRTGFWLGNPSDGKWVIDQPTSGGAELDMIGHVVGPLIRFRRSTADYIHALNAAGFVLTNLTALPTGDGTVATHIGASWPERHKFVPAFSVFEACPAEGCTRGLVETST